MKNRSFLNGSGSLYPSHDKGDYRDRLSDKIDRYAM